CPINSRTGRGRGRRGPGSAEGTVPPCRGRWVRAGGEATAGGDRPRRQAPRGRRSGSPGEGRIGRVSEGPPAATVRGRGSPPHDDQSGHGGRRGEGRGRRAVAAGEGPAPEGRGGRGRGGAFGVWAG